MPFCKKPTPLILFPKSVSRKMASFHNILWETTMSLSFPVTFICRFKKKWDAGQTSEVAKAKKSEFTAAALSSIAYWGECVDIYRRVHWNNWGYKSIDWRCVSRLEKKGSNCTSPTINEEMLKIG